MPDRPLAGQVALVTGATRGAGRGIAVELGAAGATVWCTGRSGGGHAATPGRPETLEETGALVEAAGGRAIVVRCDHTDEAQVEALAGRIRAESGRLDLLVNDIWGGDDLIGWGQRFWQIEPAAVRTLAERSILSHWMTARSCAPLMIEAKRGLIVEVTDGETAGYRGQWLYDWIKSSVIRLGYAMAWDLAGTGVTALTLTPGFLHSEHVLEIKGVTEANWRDAVATDSTFEQSETPRFIGRAIAALAGDPEVGRKAGLALHVADLADEYGFTDVDGRVPKFWSTLDATLEQKMASNAEIDGEERFIGVARYMQQHLDPRERERMTRLAERYGLTGLGAGLLPAA